MAEDGPAQPLPRRAPSSNRRVPGGKQRPEARPVRPPALSEDALQRIRDALDSMRGEASPQEHAPRAERPASLPRRTPGAGKGPQPPAVIARPRLPSVRPSLPRPPADEAPTHELPPLSVSSYSGAQADEITVQPEPGPAPPADPPQVPAPPPPAQLEPDRQHRADGATGPPEKPSSRREHEQGRLAKEPARWIKMPTARTKAASRRAKTPASHRGQDGRRGRPGRPNRLGESGRCCRVSRPRKWPCYSRRTRYRKRQRHPRRPSYGPNGPDRAVPPG